MKPVEKELIEQFQKHLKSENLSSSVLEGAENEQSALVLYIGKDVKGRERLLSIVPFAQLSTENQQETVFTVQFVAKFPFPAVGTAFHDISSMVLFHNRQSQLPGFEFDEATGDLYFRYVWMGPTAAISEKNLFMGIIGLILFNMDISSAGLEEVASGKLSFEAWIETVLKQIEDNAKPNAL